MNPRTKTAEKRKQYHLPSDLMTIWWMAKGAATLRDRYVALRFFGYKGALQAAAEHELLVNRFWKQVRTLYPSIADKTLDLNQSGSYVMVSKK